MNVLIDKDQVSKEAGYIIENTENLKNEINNFANVIDKINLAWEGPDATKIISLLKDECLTELNKFYNILQDYGIYLKNIPQGYDALDGIFSNKNIDE